jgi:UDP-2-acetamido-3-amino-2,3-dideoxy-glucuronate N-acetyltransferase
MGKPFFSHESAFIDAGATVGDGTKIWHFCHVYGSSVIGENCSIGQNVMIASNVTIGNNVKIQNNVAVYEGVTLEDFVFCGPSMVFTNVKTPRCLHPRDTSGDYTPTLVKRGASIGANATIVTGVTLHEHAFVAAGAVVTKDVPAYGLVAGVPAKLIGWMSEYGDVLDFSTNDEIVDSIGHKYQRVDAETVIRV